MLNTLNTLKSRRGRKGFSLVEILIVLLIIGILLAVAVPQLLGSRGRAGDRAAQQQLNTAATSARAALSDTEDFSGAKFANIQTAEPNLTVVSGSTAATKTGGVRSVSVGVSSDNATWYAAAPGENGNCWMVRLQAAGADGYAKSTGTCTADAAAALATGDWAKKFPAS